MSRSFTITSVEKTDGGKINFTGGRYISNTPRECVKKMFSKIIQSKSSAPRSLKIHMRETTSGSAKKEYSYKVNKQPKKVTIERNGVEITYTHIVKVQSI